MLAMRSGVARGVFSNESGLGSAPIVAAAAKTKWAAEQGLVSMTGTFIDTIIICSLTGLSLIVTGAWCGPLKGAAMTDAAFAAAFPGFGSLLLMVGLVLFAFTTILGWNYYGERACIYLFGTKGVMPYRLIFIVLVVILKGVAQHCSQLPFVWGAAQHIFRTFVLIFFKNIRVAAPNARCKPLALIRHAPIGVI